MNLYWNVVFDWNGESNCVLNEWDYDYEISISTAYSLW